MFHALPSKTSFIINHLEWFLFFSIITANDHKFFDIWTGLPPQHFSYVKNIEPGLPLFLFNYSDRKLHGIYEAASSGQMNIDPYGWTRDGSQKTQYPAQVSTLRYIKDMIAFELIIHIKCMVVID